MTRARRLTRGRSSNCRRKYASLCFVAAFLCLVTAAALSFSAFRRGRQVRAASGTTLSTVIFRTPGFLPYAADNDPVTAATCASLSAGYTNLRAAYGLAKAESSQVLDRAATYAAQNALAAIDPNAPDPDSVTASANATLKNISGISGFYVLTLAQYSAWNPAAASNYLLNSVKNTYQGAAALLRPGAGTFGTALCLLSDGKTAFACFVFCCSDTNAADANGVLANISGLLPEKLYEIDPETALAGTGGQASGAGSEDVTVYVKKGGALSAEKVSGALALRDRLGAEADVSWNAGALSTAGAGNTRLGVTVTFLGTVFLRTVNVTVLEGNTAPRIAPEITGNILPEGELVDVSEYVNVTSAGTVSRVSCSPLLLRDSSGRNTVRVIAENFAGETAVQQAECTFTGTERQPVQPSYTDNSGLNVFVDSGTQLQAGEHTLVSWNISPSQGGSGQTVYYFTFSYPDGHSETFTHTKPYICWDPSSEGIVEVRGKLTVNGSAVASSLIRVIVSRSGQTEYIPATLSFSANSGITTETYGEYNALLGLPAGTTASELKSFAAVTGGQAPYLTVSDRQGAEAADNAGLCTAFTLALYDGGQLLESYTVVILGDLNGDGAVGIGDFAMLRQQLLKGDVVTGIYLRAADLNHDGSVGIGDFAKLRQFLLGNAVLNSVPAAAAGR